MSSGTCQRTSLPDAIRRRCELLRRSLDDEAWRREEYARCSADVVHWVNSWCWTYDPREPVSLLPFDLFPRQEEFLRWLEDLEACQENGLVAKSRDMGLSWLCCAYALHRWLFRSGCAIGFGSRKLEYVDARGNPKSAFEKVRMLLGSLPGWMRPAGFREKDHSCLARLVNPANGSTITGEGGDQIGRGDRTRLYFVDEAAFLERPHLVERSLSQTTRVRIDVSTPNGPGNPFAQKWCSGTVATFPMHWKDDPRKGEAWYAKQKSQFDAVTVAQEVDIDFTASVDGIVIPAAWVRAAVGLKLPMGKANTAGLDIAELGKNKSVFVTRAGPVVFSPVRWGQVNTTETAHRAAELAEKNEVGTVYYDVTGVGVGVRGTWQTSAKKLPFRAVAVNAGESPTETRWPSGKTSKELFVNKRAELWWTLRARFERTYEFVEKGVPHPPEDMISIPNDPDLIAELSLPLCERTEAGKIKIESKDDLARRGVKSPDNADALCLSFHPEPASVKVRV